MASGLRLLVLPRGLICDASEERWQGCGGSRIERAVLVPKLFSSARMGLLHRIYLMTIQLANSNPKISNERNEKTGSKDCRNFEHSRSFI
jgi:hypothetical protein